MSKFLTAAVAAIGLGVVACGSSGSLSGTPSGPTAVPPNAITINVVGINGAQSFSPNPATISADQTVVWHNVDRVTHRVVLNDGELDTGDIAPGASSAAMLLIAPGAYHCSIHPPMIGSIAGGQ
jgi:plastocyanin